MSTLRPLRSTISEPAGWAVAFSVATYESISFNLDVIIPEHGDAITSAIEALFYLLLIALTAKIKTLKGRPGLVPTMFVVMILSLALSVTSGGERVVLDYLDGLLVFACAIGFILLAMEHLVGVSLIWTIRSLLASGVICACLVPIYRINPFWSVALTAFGATAFLTLAERTLSQKNGPVAQHGQPAANTTGLSAACRALRSHSALIAGFLVIAASFGFLQSFLYLEPQGVVATVSATTKLLAALIFGAVALHMLDTGYVPLAKITCSLGIIGLACFLAFGTDGLAGPAFMATACSVFELTYPLVMVNVAAVSKMPPIRVFSTFYLIDCVGYMLGIALFDAAAGDMASATTSVTGGARTNVASTGVQAVPEAALMVALGLTVALALVAIWAFSEKRMNALLWNKTRNTWGAESGRTPEKDLPLETDQEDAPPSQPAESSDPVSDCNGPSRLTFDEKASLLIDRAKLSKREAEVLRMFSLGRSAAFIAEATFVSTSTVRTHIKHIYTKCEVHSRQELITLIENES